MQKVKTVLLIVGAVLLLVLGVVGRSLFDRRRVRGSGVQPDGTGTAIDNASGANDGIADAVDASIEISESIGESTTASQRLIQRSRDILAKAKNRSSGTDG